MNEEWIDRNLDFLFMKLKDFNHNPDNVFFEPTDKIYNKLESGNEQDLQYVTNEISKYLGIINIPSAKYDWGIKMEPGVAGQIRNANHINSIQIPFFYVGRKYGVGCILAHEITHAFLYSKGIELTDLNENEMLTDLTSIFIGLGKFILNGQIMTLEEHLNESYIVGYLSPELIIYSYKKLIRIRSIKKEKYTCNLKPEIKNRILAKNKIQYE